jgi:hypothetical protein
MQEKKQARQIRMQEKKQARQAARQAGRTQGK